jgi:hypothetical protein
VELSLAGLISFDLYIFIRPYKNWCIRVLVLDLCSNVQYYEDTRTAIQYGCGFVGLLVCLFVCWVACVCVCVCFVVCVCVCVCLCVWLVGCLLVCLFACLLVCLFVCVCAKNAYILYAGRIAILQVKIHIFYITDCHLAGKNAYILYHGLQYCR